MCLNNLTVSRKTREPLCLLPWPQQTLSHVNNLTLIPLPYTECSLATSSTGAILKDRVHINTTQTCPKY